jgi:APA family basic amino acid/polyamine antiporter
LSAAVILTVLFVYRPATTFPGLVIVLIGVPVYFIFRRSGTEVTSPAPVRE